METTQARKTDVSWEDEPQAYRAAEAIEVVDTPVTAREPAREETAPPAKGSYESVASLTPADVAGMHGLFCEYYENTDLATFRRDLAKKDAVVLLREKATGRIRGFSTIMRMRVRHDTGEAVGFFSGDTIIDRAYWGGSHLRFAYMSFILIEKLRNIGKPIYWFLISKGYKTYLVMANNMEHYYPRYDKPDDPFLRSLAMAYCKRLYPEQLDEDRGLLIMGDGAQHLKGEVAPITAEMRDRYPKIRFFDDRNPNWRSGDELPCAGKITIPLILKAALKFSRKWMEK